MASLRSKNRATAVISGDALMRRTRSSAFIASASASALSRRDAPLRVSGTYAWYWPERRSRRRSPVPCMFSHRRVTQRPKIPPQRGDCLVVMTL